MDRVTLRDGCLDVMVEGLTFANGLLLGGNDVIDAETWDSSDIQHRKALRRLALLAEDVGLSDADLGRHPGHEPIPADRDTHVVMQHRLRILFPGCYVVGEEATEHDWWAAIGSPPGSLIFSIDALDGSTLYESFTFGYACNLLAYRRVKGNENLLMFAAVMNSSGFVACYQRDEQGALVGNVYTATDIALGTDTDDSAARGAAIGKRLVSITDPVVLDGFRADTVATNASDPARRRVIAPLLADKDLYVSTLGGAPAALGLVLGGLAALVCPRAQTTYDTAYLPILASLGITIYTMHEGKEGFTLGLKEVLGFFDHLAGVGGAWTTEGVTKPVPAFVAARNPQFGAELRRRIIEQY
ncbi:hypothetical protein [Nocardia sp. NPDC052566]|uniref:hypothetical protein n=1 Tax=Nocardia sp. NPDC052566 TaxID=3364330 RepID=UPI0037C8B2E4